LIEPILHSTHKNPPHFIPKEKALARNGYTTISSQRPHFFNVINYQPHKTAITKPWLRHYKNRHFLPMRHSLQKNNKLFLGLKNNITLLFAPSPLPFRTIFPNTKRPFCPNNFYRRATL
jgi:hypothetical protein